VNGGSAFFPSNYSSMLSGSATTQFGSMSTPTFGVHHSRETPMVCFQFCRRVYVIFCNYSHAVVLSSQDGMVVYNYGESDLHLCCASSVSHHCM